MADIVTGSLTALGGRYNVDIIDKDWQSPEFQDPNIKPKYRHGVSEFEWGLERANTLAWMGLGAAVGGTVGGTLGATVGGAIGGETGMEINKAINKSGHVQYNQDVHGGGHLPSTPTDPNKPPPIDSGEIPNIYIVYGDQAKQSWGNVPKYPHEPKKYGRRGKRGRKNDRKGSK